MSGGPALSLHNPLDRAWFDLTTLAVIGAVLTWSAWSLAADAGSSGTRLLLLPALLLVMGVFAGRLAERAGLPRLTGYILLGALVGPHAPVLVGMPDVPGLLSKNQVEALKPVKDLAIGVIALMAGCEIRFGWLRQRWRSILVIACSQAVLIPIIMAAAMLLPIDLPYLQQAQAEGYPLWPIIGLTGILALVSSPMVVVSVIKEARAKGPLSETAMGAAVLKDVLVLLGFSLMVAILVSLGPSGTANQGIGSVIAAVGLQEIGLICWSIGLGVIIGYGLYRYTEATRQRVGWALVGIALLIALLEDALHVEPLFCLLTAGFAAENVWRGRSEQGCHRLEQALGRVSLPVFVIFFIVAGLGLDLKTLIHAYVPVLWFVGMRLIAIVCSVWIGTTVVSADPAVKRWCWSAMIPQAGVTLALVIVVADQFPGWGKALKDMIIAAVAIHELSGPIILTLALKRSGERNRADS